jgi:hypothetical protein
VAGHRSAAFLAVVLILVICPGCRRPAPPSPIEPASLARAWDAEHLPLPPAPLVRHDDVVRLVQQVTAASGGAIATEAIGASVEGRRLHHLWFGHGRTHVLLWSQMHGDESTATSALFDVLAYVTRHRHDPAVARMIDSLTVHVVPMLNPDGAERWSRRNAQGIDINRDARMLETPEGRVLKALRDRVKPLIGFNLHNQSWRTSVGRSSQPASLSLLAVAHDETRQDNPRRRLAKRVAAVIRDAVEPFAVGRLGRYDDHFNVRAFGDNIARWGTGVVLIETGPWPGPEPDRALVRLNFVAILAALDSLASGAVERADPLRYESLPENGSSLFHCIVKGGSVWNRIVPSLYRADVGLVGEREVRETPAGRAIVWESSIEDIGDLGVHGALQTIDATGLIVAPELPNARVGDVVALPQPVPKREAQITRALADRATDAPKGPPTIAVGEPARLTLLKPLEGGRYRVERLVQVP